MNLNAKFSKEIIYSLYEDNKNYAIPVLSIVISFLLFFIFIVPQVLTFPNRKQEVDIENAKLSKIKEAEKVILRANPDQIESQLRIATKALPSTKAFEEILGSLLTAAALSGAQIENYKFDSQSMLQTDPQTTKFSTLLFEVTIIGSTKAGVEFIKELYKTNPASNAISILTSSGLTNVKILFYYKSFSPVSIENRTQVRSISSSEKAALDEISKWNDSSIGDIFEIETEASESATIDSSPF